MVEPAPFSFEKADDSAGFLLWKVTSLWQRKLAAVLSALGITQTQYALLASTRWLETRVGRVTQARLVEHTRIDKMTVSKAIRRIEVAGLVVRSTSSLDSRTTDVVLTSRGRKLTDRAIAAVEAADRDFFAGLSDEGLGRYRDLALTLIAHNDPPTS